MCICRKKRKINYINNRGMTLIEMIVSFALLAIFLASAAAIIGTVSMMYFDVKGENYSRQVSDIVMEKLESEIDGAKIESGASVIAPKIQKEVTGSDVTGVSAGKAIILTDKTNTKVKLYAEKGEIVVHYYPIGETYNSTDWKFDKSVYNHFTIENLYFVRGDMIGDGSVGVDVSEYGLNGVTAGTYGKDIVGIFMKMHNPRYGDYYSYRLVKMYNYTE